MRELVGGYCRKNRILTLCVDINQNSFNCTLHSCTVSVSSGKLFDQNAVGVWKVHLKCTMEIQAGCVKWGE